MDPEFAIAPAEEKGLRGSPHRLFLSSKTGYITTELFHCIMTEFTKWWTDTHPGLECFLISDNLSIHRNEMIVKEARRNGIHMLNIMPGSSHWFQVHDQLPFATLKKQLMIENNKSFGSFLVPREVSRTILMCNFYKAEAYALRPEVVVKSFDDVGLWPFNPEKILENCRKFCPVKPQPNESDDVSNLARAIKTCMSDELQRTSQMLREMKCVRVTSLKKAEKRNRKNKKAAISQRAANGNASTSTRAKSKHTASKPPKKRGRPAKAKSKK